MLSILSFAMVSVHHMDFYGLSDCLMSMLRRKVYASAGSLHTASGPLPLLMRTFQLERVCRIEMRHKFHLKS